MDSKSNPQEENFLKGVEEDFPPPTGDAVRDGLNRLNARSDRFLARRGPIGSDDDDNWLHDTML